MGESDPERAVGYVEAQLNLGIFDLEDAESIAEGRGGILDYVKKTAYKSSFPEKAVIKGFKQLLAAEHFDGIVINSIPYAKELQDKSGRTLGLYDKVRVESWKGIGDFAVARNERGWFVSYMKI